MCLPKMQAGMEVSNRDGLHIRKASGENWRSIAALSVSGKQQSYIESNAYSLAESVFEPNWCSVGLYDGETLVGFAMYGTGPEQKEVWLDRFMIDSRFQGQGYARRFLPVLIGCIKNQYECDAIYLRKITAGRRSCTGNSGSRKTGKSMIPVLLLAWSWCCRSDQHPINRDERKE